MVALPALPASLRGAAAQLTITVERTTLSWHSRSIRFNCQRGQTDIAACNASVQVSPQ